MLLEPFKKKVEVVLYRCTCRNCDISEEMIGKLQRKYSFLFKVEQVLQKPGWKDQAGWSTPMVYIEGKEISHYSIEPKKWISAIEDALKKLNVEIT